MPRLGRGSPRQNDRQCFPGWTEDNRLMSAIAALPVRHFLHMDHFPNFYATGSAPLSHQDRHPVSAVGWRLVLFSTPAERAINKYLTIDIYPKLSRRCSLRQKMSGNSRPMPQEPEANQGLRKLISQRESLSKKLPSLIDTQYLRWLYGCSRRDAPWH